MDLTIRPLTPDLWPAFEDLFGKHGASIVQAEPLALAQSSSVSCAQPPSGRQQAPSGAGQSAMLSRKFRLSAAPCGRRSIMR